MLMFPDAGLQKALVFVVPKLLFFSLSFSSMCLRTTKVSSWLADLKHPGTAVCWFRKGRLCPSGCRCHRCCYPAGPAPTEGWVCMLLYCVVREHLLLLRTCGMCPVLASNRGGWCSVLLGANSQLPCFSSREIIPKWNNKQKSTSNSLKTWVGIQSKVFSNTDWFPTFSPLISVSNNSFPLLCSSAVAPLIHGSAITKHCSPETWKWSKLAHSRAKSKQWYFFLIGYIPIEKLIK